MKVKTEKQLNLPQLIEWAMDNDVTDRMFLTENSYCVGFDRHGFIYFNSSRTMPLYQTFTVEVEEELTEDTVIPKLVELYEDTLSSNKGSNEILINENISIRRAKDEDECPSRAFYIINDDLTFTLIWRDGKLVE